MYAIVEILTCGNLAATVQNTQVRYRSSGFVKEDNAIDDAAKQRIETSLIKSFYYILQLVDNYYHNPDTKDSEYKLTTITTILYMQLIRKLAESCAKYPLLASTLGNALLRPVRELSKEPIMMYHGHDDYSRPQPKPTERTECGCSILQLLLRFQMISSTGDQQDLLQNMCVQLFASYRFKQQIGVEFVKHYLFNYDLNPGNGLCINKSEFVDIMYQFIASEALAPYIYEHGDMTQFMQAVTYLMRHIIEYNSNLQKTYQEDAYTTSCHINSMMIELFKAKQVFVEFLSNGELCKAYFGLFKIQKDHMLEFIPGFNFLGQDDLLTNTSSAANGTLWMQHDQVFKASTTQKNFLSLTHLEKSSLCLAIIKTISDLILVQFVHRETDAWRACATDATLERMLVSYILCYAQIDIHE